VQIVSTWPLPIALTKLFNGLSFVPFQLERSEAKPPPAGSETGGRHVLVTRDESLTNETNERNRWR